MPGVVVGEDRFDVCIVGGSIAGAPLACHLAAEGFSVCLFERRRRDERKLCAELTHVNLLDRIAAFTGCEACRETVSAPLDRVEVVAGPFELERRFELGKGITVDRLALEGLLLDRAASLGASVRNPVQVEDVVVSREGVTVSAEGHQVHTQVVVGADGASSLVARRCSRPWRREEVGATRHVRLPVAPAELTTGPSTMRFDLLPDVAGYGWLVPYDGEIGVGVGGFSGAVHDHFDRLLERYERVAAGRAGRAGAWAEMARRTVRGAPVPAAGPARSTWGERFLLVGDAAGFVSPASGEGLSLAVTSVETAASALKLCFASGAFRGRSLRHYERLWRRVMPDFAGLISLRNAMAGAQGIAWLEACDTDLERLALLAPLVGTAELGATALQLLERLRRRVEGQTPTNGGST